VISWQTLLAAFVSCSYCLTAANVLVVISTSGIVAILLSSDIKDKIIITDDIPSQEYLLKPTNILTSKWKWDDINKDYIPGKFLSLFLYIIDYFVWAIIHVIWYIRVWLPTILMSNKKESVCYVKSGMVQGLMTSMIIWSQIKDLRCCSVISELMSNNIFWIWVCLTNGDPRNVIVSGNVILESMLIAFKNM